MNKKEFGDFGEKKALEFLLEKGYVIIEKNWRFKHKEIDLITRKDNLLVFVEVKIRESNYFENPYDAVGKKKQNLLIDAADAYIQQKGVVMNCRFDIISIYKEKEEFKITHLIDAFQPDF